LLVSDGVLVGELLHPISKKAANARSQRACDFKGLSFRARCVAAFVASYPIAAAVASR
jgi:hypothetical protein